MGCGHKMRADAGAVGMAMRSGRWTGWAAPMRDQRCWQQQGRRRCVSVAIVGNDDPIAPLRLGAIQRRISLAVEFVGIDVPFGVAATLVAGGASIALAPGRSTHTIRALSGPESSFARAEAADPAH